MSEVTSKTIAELRDGFRAGEFSAREIAEAYNAAVAASKTLNAYTVETPEDALSAAEAADSGKSTGSLAGIPLGIKDLFATKGVDSTAGSRILKGFRPTYESTVTANLRRAGAGMLGKLNMPTLAAWLGVPLGPGSIDGHCITSVAECPGVVGRTERGKR